MKIVIKISEEDYKDAKNGMCNDCSPLENRIIDAVANGTPLPKGHGDLKDADNLIERLNNYIPLYKRCEDKDDLGRIFGYEDSITNIKNAPTIIEAESED